MIEIEKECIDEINKILSGEVKPLPMKEEALKELQETREKCNYPISSYLKDIKPKNKYKK